MSDATTPAVVPDAQRYDGREDLEHIRDCVDISECADGCCTYFDSRHAEECDRLAAYIERLQAERDDRERWWHECQQIAEASNARAREAEARAAEWIDRCYRSEERALKAEAERDALDALLVEHEALLPHASRRLARQRREDGTR